MLMSERYALQSADIVSESFDGEFVVLDLSCGKYFSFSDSANIIWEAVSSGVVPTHLLEGSSSISPPELESFVQVLIGHGLIAPQQIAVADVPVADFLSRLAAATEKLDVTVFDDLADLFKADPIHDVEEPVGWPAIRQA